MKTEVQSWFQPVQQNSTSKNIHVLLERHVSMNYISRPQGFDKAFDFLISCLLRNGKSCTLNGEETVEDIAERAKNLLIEIGFSEEEIKIMSNEDY